MAKWVILCLLLVVLIRISETQTVDGTLRLYNESIVNEGILEIYHSNRWGSICDDYWDSTDSQVACRHMGFPGYFSYSISQRVSSDFWLDDIDCNGDEVAITDCSNRGWGSDNCGSHEGIFLKCFLPAEGALRLYGGFVPNAGILEVFHSNRWGSICDDGWSSNADQVVCRQMGFSGYTSHTSYRTISNSFWLDDVSCNGDEASILSCSNLGWEIHNCGSSEGIFIQCTDTADGTLRLYDGKTENEGTLEIFHSNRWGSICDHSWDSTDSKVACLQMGFQGYVSYATSMSVQSEYWIDHVGCSGNEATLSSCSNNGWRTVHCGLAEGVYLKCNPPAEGALRLIGGTTEYEGVLEIFHFTQWGSICDDHWDSVDSQIACQQMGFREHVSYTSSSTIKSTFWLDDVRCNGYETAITSCSTLEWGSHNCGSREGIFLECHRSVPTYGCDAISDEGICFSYFTSSGVNWATARQRCVSWGYDLATVKSLRENTLMYSRGTSTSSCWLGLYDSQSEGNFVWVDGSDSMYRNWRWGQPDDYHGAEDCVHTWDRSDWNDLPCTSSLSCYFCSANVNQFGQIIGSTYTSLTDNAVIASDTTLFCLTENMNTPRVVWRYQNLAKGSSSSLSASTSTTTGVSTMRVYTSRPGYYSCTVTVNGGTSKTYTALITDADLSTADGSLRLYGSTENAGILEIFHDNRWGSICHNSWDTRDSTVACKQMGFPGYSYYDTYRSITHLYWLDSTGCFGNEESITACSDIRWKTSHCRSNQGVYLRCQAAVTFGRIVRTSVYPLADFETLQQSATLYCSTDINSNTVQIGWTFRPFFQNREESLTNSAEWESAFGMSKLYISTSKLGYYSCHTSTGGLSKKYTVMLTQSALNTGCQGGYCFGVFTTDRGINWDTAQSNCMSWGGDLASIRSMGEEKYILSLGESHYGSCWIGHHDRYNEAGNNGSLFVSVGGSNSLYRNFYTNEPNGNSNEDCVILRDWNEGGWKDKSCDSTLSCYVCGKPNCRDGSCFEVFTADTSVNRDSAQSQCELKGGSLASIRSEPEEKFILNLMTESSNECWIGLNDLNREAYTDPNVYVWEDGNTAVYRHFRNQAVSSYSDCVVLSRVYGTWLSTECSNLLSCYICKGADICATGYEFITEEYDCLDINECSVANDCEQICTNTVGSYMCSCRERYYLSNFTSCELIYLNVDVSGTNQSSTSIQLIWNTEYCPSDRLSEIVYHVCIRDVTFEESSNFIVKTITANLYSRIVGLLPYRTYEIYILAIDGETTNTSNAITVQTLTGIPSTSPSLSAVSINPVTIRLNITQPSRETRNGIIIGYCILYSRVEQSGELHIQVPGTELTHDIAELHPYTRYKLRAAARTSVGTGVYTEYVYVRTLESIPTGTPDIIVLEISPKSICLHLCPPDDVEEINGVIISYTVKYEGREIDTEAREDTSLVTLTDFLSPIKANITGLEEGVEYSLQARISTSVGGGPYSSPVTVTTTETAPTGPPLQFKITLHLPTLLTVCWNSPELELQNGVITGYLVHYHGLYVDTEDRNFTTESLKVNLTNLEEGALYEISVCALNEAGEGPCVELTNRTREIPPDQSPQDVEVEVDGSTSLVVCWDALLQTEENGIILNYFITAIGQGYDTGEYEFIANSTARCYTCDNLQEDTPYSVSMSAVNSAGTGPFSSAVVVVTPEDKPSAAPQGVFGIGNDRVIVLLWSPPPLPEQNGHILKYEIHYFGTAIERTKYNITSSATNVIMSALHEGETYHIKVRAYTSKGAGPYSTIVSVNTLETPPSAPPTNITLTTISSTQILVTWQEPPLTDRNGVIISYELLISSSNGQEVIQVDASLRAYTFRNLSPNTIYSVRVRAKTLPGAGPYSDPLTGATSGKPPVD